ncbi:IS3 family transposase [Micrococcus luteus]|uniref:IS3 family transposase n=1 Tax=Micrococcus luteus TaxID=1270 RepID=UPI0016282A1F
MSYRAAKTRPASTRALRDEILFKEIRRVHAENYCVYGVRKMHHAMRRAGWEIGRDQVRRPGGSGRIHCPRRSLRRACLFRFPQIAIEHHWPVRERE